MARKNEELIKRIQKVGEGGFGVVYLGSYGEYKEVGIKDIKGRLSDEALTEATVLKKLTHRNIIHYIDVIQTRNQTSLIMEFIDGGSLLDYIQRTSQSTAYWKATRQMMIDVAYGMSYLHEERIVHADLKSLNVLLRHNYDAVICDFGLARVIGDSRTMITNYAVGTEAWFAPELCFDRPERSSYSSDVWAYGCILLEIISKKFPWGDNYRNSSVLLKALAESDNAIIFENICRTQNGPEKLRELLCRCCTWQKTERPKFPTIVRDLLAISDVDLHSINQGKEKSMSSKSSNVRPSTSTKRSPAKTSSSSSSKVDYQDCDDIVTPFDQIKLENPKPKRKPPVKHQTTDPGDQSTSADTKKYDAFHDRYLYKGPRGGWYYTGSSGNKVYIKNDLD